MIEGKLFPYDSTSNTNFVLYQSQQINCEKSVLLDHLCMCLCV